MALSAAMQWALNNGMTAADVYKNINDFLATNPTAAQSQAQMAQYGISGEDVAAATGGKSGGMLGGNILAGASWNSLNTTLGDQLTAATGQASSNYSVGGATTADTLKQLDTFLAGGGQFDPNATVYLQTGGVDFLQGVDKGTIKDNISQMVKTLGDQGVNVVLTGSPYAASLNDVQTNNFNPAVDPLFTEIAKENKNVALVGTQGEILQNKALLVDALHTNAEGTAIYNQSVIDALSQFKNEVPASTPQAIAQVQQTNTVATTPPIITQAAASPAVAQSLATQTVDSLIKAGNLNPTQIAAATGVPVSEIITQAAALAPFQGSTKLGDTYVSPNYSYTQSGEETIVGGLESIGTSKVSSEQGSRTELYSPTGELTSVGTYDKGPSFFGGLADALNDPVVQAAFLGLGGGGAVGNLLGLTGSTAQAVGTGLFKGGTAAAGGADLSDALKTGLLSGGLVYGGNLLANMDVPVDFNNMTADELNDALQTNLVKDLKQAGVGSPQEFLTGQGRAAGTYIQESVAASNLANNLSAQGLNSGEIAQLLDSAGFVPTAITDALDSLSSVASTGGLLSSTVTTPVTDSVNITGQSLANIPTTVPVVTSPVTNAGTVNVTGTTQPQQVDQATLNLINSQLASNVTTPANLANVQVTGNKGMMSGDTTATDILNTLAGLPTTTPTTTTPTQTITADRPATQQELVNAITATLPTVTPAQAATVAEQVITSGRPITVQDAVTALTATLPAVTTPVTTPTTTPSTVDPRVTITADRPAATTQDLIGAAIAALPSVTTPTVTPDPRVTITADRPAATTQELVNVLTAVTPTVTTPTTTPTTVPTQTITADRPAATTQDLVNAATAILPAVTTPTTTPTVPTQTITAARPTNVGDTLALLPATLLPPSVTTPTVPTPAAKTNELGLTDAQMLALLQGGLGLLGGLGGASLIGGGGGGTTNVGGIPTQGMPTYNDDYFTKVQQNYNRILPAVPRDVASPLRDWYLSQYGA